jgi:SHS2 domain-containing protein
VNEAGERGMGEGWSAFEHTADLGLEVWADTPARLFEVAAVALLAQMIEPPAGPPTVHARIELTGDDLADLFVHWLNTALLEADVRAATWTACTVERLDRLTLVATLAGVPRDPARQVFLREIKAVSHHALELALTPPCRARVVLDL